MAKHTEPHPLAGKTVKLNETTQDLHRGMVVAGADLPVDDEVVYGKIVNKDGIGLGHMVHVSELGEVVG